MDQAGRVLTAIDNTKQKAPFAFDENGNPIESLQPLIEKEVERQTDIWADRTAEANALMRDDEFFNLAEMCFAESYVVLGFTSDSKDETGKKLYFGNDREEAEAVVNNPIGPCVRKLLFALTHPVAHFDNGGDQSEN